MQPLTKPRASRFTPLGGRIRVSFEFFPPKTEEMEKTLWESITRLAPLAPSFVSVTYGAGGSTRERTHATVKRIIAETFLAPAAHLTCVAADCTEIDDVVRAYVAAGVRHIVALRGDPVGGVGERYAPHPPLGRYRGVGLGLSGETPRQPVGAGRYRYAAGQGGCRGNAGDHAVLLR
jgi:methylenetetrahydrofolate reductase (NADPH)